MRALAALALMAGPALADCPPAPEPVLGLDFGSRYVDDDRSRSTLDAERDASVDEELGPLDDFIRDLAERNDAALESGGSGACAMAHLAVWAEADALGALESRNANMTLGARLAGLSIAALRAEALGGTERADRRAVAAWLGRIAHDQAIWWDAEGPDGARRGNLRAWAALGSYAAGRVADDPILTGWGLFSARRVICTADPDGAIPQEMRRGHRALHYQLHAIAPLATLAALAPESRLHERCDGALRRIVDFALDDLRREGRATERLTGDVQTFFDGSDELRAFDLAWLPAWRDLRDAPDYRLWAEEMGPFSSSKLGGDQTAIWAAGGPAG